MTQTLAIHRPDQAIATRRDYMPVMSMADAIDRRNAIVEFTRGVMKTGIDFGIIPGTDKPTLLKPGAEKLITLFGLTPRYQIIEKTEDWTGANHGGEPFFYYLYRCQLWHGESLVAESDASASSWEKKHRWRWVSDSMLPEGVDKSKLRSRGGSIREPEFALKKRETSGKYGKPASHWDRFEKAIADGTAKAIKIPKKNNETMAGWEIEGREYRIANDDPADVVNTIQKMGQKRALVGTTLLAINASEFFTQDAEDMELLDGGSTTSAKSNVVEPPSDPESTMLVDDDGIEFDPFSFDLMDDGAFRYVWHGFAIKHKMTEEEEGKFLATHEKRGNATLATADLPKRQAIMNAIAGISPDALAEFRAMLARVKAKAQQSPKDEAAQDGAAK